MYNSFEEYFVNMTPYEYCTAHKQTYILLFDFVCLLNFFALFLFPLFHAGKHPAAIQEGAVSVLSRVLLAASLLVSCPLSDR